MASEPLRPLGSPSHSIYPCFVERAAAHARAPRAWTKSWPPPFCDANRASTRTKVYATIYRGFGTPHEKVARNTGTLAAGKEMHHIAEVVTRGIEPLRVAISITVYPPPKVDGKRRAWPSDC